jgi:hypothetical protein
MCDCCKRDCNECNNPKPEGSGASRQIDWNKPIQYKSWDTTIYPARVVGEFGNPPRKYVAITWPDGGADNKTPYEGIHKCTKEGYVEMLGQLENVPPKMQTLFVNIYKSGYAPGFKTGARIYTSEEQAKKIALTNYIKTIPVTIEVPE